jgi:hypothetical protein
MGSRANSVKSLFVKNSLIFLFYCSLVIVLFAILSHGLPYFGRKIIHVGENS